MKKIYIEFRNMESEFINNVIENFKYSKAYKYLEYYKQSNNKYINHFNDFESPNFIEWFDYNDYFIKEIDATWYNQSEWQDFYFYFKPDIQKDSEAMQELEYLVNDLGYYFTAQDILISWYIEHTKNIDWLEYKAEEVIEEGLYITLLDDPLTFENVIEFIKQNWLDPKKYELVFDLENIIY